MKKNNKKGFTLAELLIVVAIIAVLTAIAIPVFTSTLEKSRDSASISNIRAAYAEAQAVVLANAYLTDGHAAITEGHVSIPTGFDFGNMEGEVTVAGVDIESQVASDDWSGLLPADLKQGELQFPEDNGKTGGKTRSVVFTYDTDDDKVTSIVASFGGGTTGGGTTGG